MKSVVIGLLAVVGCAMSAQADLLSLPAGAPVYTSLNSNLAAVPISDYRPGETDTGPAAYSSIPGPYSAFNVGPINQFDDYSTGAPPGLFLLDAVRFVGGVATAGGQLNFFFRDSADTTTIASFGIVFPTGGNSVWTLSFGVNDPLVPTSGLLRVQSNSAAAADNGQWFFTTTAPSVGSNVLATGTPGTLSPQRYQAFELQVPAPGSLALLSLGGLLAARRRR